MKFNWQKVKENEKWRTKQIFLWYIYIYIHLYNIYIRIIAEYLQIYTEYDYNMIMIILILIIGSKICYRFMGTKATIYTYGLPVFLLLLSAGYYLIKAAIVSRYINFRKLISFHLLCWSINLFTRKKKSNWEINEKRRECIVYSLVTVRLFDFHREWLCIIQWNKSNLRSGWFTINLSTSSDIYRFMDWLDKCDTNYYLSLATRNFSLT